MFRSSMLAKSAVMGLAIVLVASSASYAQGQRGNRGFGGFGRGASTADLVRREQVQKELKITEEPVGAVIDFMQDNLAEEIDYGTVENQIISPDRKSVV